LLQVLQVQPITRDTQRRGYLPRDCCEVVILVRARGRVAEFDEVKTGFHYAEGVFDGQNMVGSDGKTYPVPANYASKSKLVQGDILKLTITDDGSFLYKQIGPIPRKQVVGSLQLENGHYFVNVGDKQYRVLLASVTYFKAKPGDQVSVNVPEADENAEWAALEAAL